MSFLAPSVERATPRRAGRRGASPRSAWSWSPASPGRSRWTCSPPRPPSRATRRCCSAPAASPSPPDAHHRRRHPRAGQGVRPRRRRRGAPGHRDGAAARRGGLRVRRAPGGAGAGAEPRRDVRRGGAGERARARAATRRSWPRSSSGRCSRRSARHIKDMDLVITTAQIPGKRGSAADHRRDGRARCSRARSSSTWPRRPAATAP